MRLWHVVSEMKTSSELQLIIIWLWRWKGVSCMQTSCSVRLTWTRETFTMKQCKNVTLLLSSCTLDVFIQVLNWQLIHASDFNPHNVKELRKHGITFSCMKVILLHYWLLSSYCFIIKDLLLLYTIWNRTITYTTQLTVFSSLCKTSTDTIANVCQSNNVNLILFYYIACNKYSYCM